MLPNHPDFITIKEKQMQKEYTDQGLLHDDESRLQPSDSVLCSTIVVNIFYKSAIEDQTATFLNSPPMTGRLMVLHPDRARSILKLFIICTLDRHHRSSVGVFQQPQPFLMKWR
ncbi:hypothetical protein SDJN03_02372, partial [Cucurbita argyrosperma subsp. sororia]